MGSLCDERDAAEGGMILVIATALGCGLIGGAFFAFSTFVMKALARLPTPQGIAAMQSINVVVITPLFLDASSAPGRCASSCWSRVVEGWRLTRGGVPSPISSAPSA